MTRFRQQCLLAMDQVECLLSERRHVATDHITDAGKTHDLGLGLQIGGVRRGVLQAAHIRVAQCPAPST